MRFFRLLPVILFPSLLLGGCADLLPRLAGAPPALYELTPLPPSVPVEPGKQKSAARLPVQILIDVPQSSAGLDTSRIALRGEGGTLAYFKDVSWTDRAPVMVQTLLVNSFDNTGRLAGVGRESMGLRSDYLLKPELEALQAEYGTQTGPHLPTIRMTVRLKLVAMPRRVIVASEVFSAEILAEADTMDGIRSAFQQSARDVMTQAVAWTLASVTSVR